MSSKHMKEEEKLKELIQETIDFMSFSVKKETNMNGSMGFKMKAKNGEDMSFIMHIEESKNGKEAYGEFGDPTDADILLTIPPEDFLRIYSGELGVSAITSLILRGKISVRNYDLNGVSQFMNSFEFTTQKWDEFYAYQDKMEEQKRKAYSRLASYMHPYPYVSMWTSYKPWADSQLFREIYCDVHAIPKLSDYLNVQTQPILVENSRLVNAYSTTSLPILEPVIDDDDDMDDSAIGLPLSATDQVDNEADNINKTTETESLYEYPTKPVIPSLTSQSSSTNTSFSTAPLHRVLMNGIISSVQHFIQTMNTTDKQLELVNYSGIPLEEDASGYYDEMLKRVGRSVHDMFKDGNTLDMGMYTEESPLNVMSTIDIDTNVIKKFINKHNWTLFNHKVTISPKNDNELSLK